MRTLMINPNSNLVLNKMRDEMYLKHLRQVEQINNREAEEVKSGLKDYRSITQLHNRNKMYAREWDNQVKEKNLLEKNTQIQ